ncbi:hypothetical protein EDB19DRAFT_1906729 [Suillus lakei]|nr:hypothetical protein EDB19DRAFT_1906729 [Suillus lakei]
MGKILAVALAAVSYTKASSPPGAAYINPLQYNVVFDPTFLEVTGRSATIRKITSNPGFAFAHEAPIYVPDLNLVFFASNGGGALGGRPGTVFYDWRCQYPGSGRALLPPAIVRVNPSPPYNTTVLLDNFFSTDTGLFGGFLGTNQTLPATM